MTAAPARPEVGDILMVIHDFTARSSDELSLAKGDRVQLLERDDEFGDGWFLGKHMLNGNSGLFPEVYTRPSPKSISTAAPPKPATTETEPTPVETTPVAPPNNQPDPASPASDPAPPPLASASEPTVSHQSQGSRSSGGIGIPGLHETLNVIDEHIDNLRLGPGNGSSTHLINDSGSEYSSHIGHRLSYIAGEETDEEDEGTLSRLEVEGWNPDQVAEYLFTSGVEKHHCEVFRDQEITGEVLLGMDQTSLFIKAFDLGSVGRRLKTWQKIKALQDEVSGLLGSRRTFGSEASSDGVKRTRSRNNTITGSISKLPAIDDRPLSDQKRRSIAGTPKFEPGSPASSRIVPDSPGRPSHVKRPSAASVRDLHHSRRHSASIDFQPSQTPVISNVASSTPKLMSSGTFPLAEVAHRKQPSFDRNWTLGSARPVSGSRPISGSGFLSPDAELQDSAVDLDRGYFSSAEGGKTRNVLKKRDSVASHSRNGSYADEQRVRSATAMARHSRYGSFSSARGEPVSPAAQKYYGVAAAGNHRRTLSTNTTESLRPVVPSKDIPPAVTKLDTGSSDNLQVSPLTPVSPGGRQSGNDGLKGPIKVPGLRAISDAVTGSERAKIAPAIDSPLRDSPMQSPSRTGSSTPSAGPSFEMDSPDATKSPSTVATQGSRSSRNKPKNKKDTSAYTRGLLKVSPREAMVDADYSGWMKKKSNTLMTTWKPRLFVLKGRRLAYYYSEDDEQEKGLIDISFHRVLPADNEKLTGLHATLTGASASPMVPANTTVATIADAQAAKDTTSSSDSIFIFKLVPPRAGLSRAVNFTKPTVHYFAVPNIKQGRLWMAALMKATIDRDDTAPIVTSYQQKTISLTKARAMRHRPPALMNLDEKLEGTDQETRRPSKDANGGLGIFNGTGDDSAVSGLEKLGLTRVESEKSKLLYPENGGVTAANLPQSA